MTTLAQLRKTALALPEVEEGTHFGMVAFKVRGKGFVSLTKEGLLQLSMNDEECERVLERISQAERLTRNGKPLGVSVPLSAVSGKELNSLIERSWESRAPKRLVAAGRAANRGEALAGPDSLPESIGQPATRALARAGVTSLNDLEGKSETELLALHGFGPKALGILREVLAQRGLAFGSDEGK